MIRIFITLLVGGCMLLSWSGDVMPASQAQSKIRSIEVNRAGAVIGFEIEISQRPRMSLWISGVGRVQWLMVSLGTADVLVATGGRVSLAQLQHKGRGQITLDNHQRVSIVNGVRFVYEVQHRNRVAAILWPNGGIKFKYLMDGRFSQIGKSKLTYLTTGQLKKVMQTSIVYTRLYARLVQVGPIKIKTDSTKNRTLSIGNAHFQYHSIFGQIVRLSGVEKRAQVRVLWYNANVCNGFQRRGGVANPRKSPYPY